MSISPEDIKKAAHLARLEFDAADAKVFEQKITNILKMVDELSELNTDDILPLAHPMDLTQTLRADVITESNERDLALAIAPLAEDGLYLVPQVIEQGESNAH